MHNQNHFMPTQPHWIISYWNSGKLTHISVLLFMLESLLYWNLFQWAVTSESTLWTILWFICFVFSFIHIFLVQADGWSRFQDYKRAKDQIFTYGCSSRILIQYSSSQCQRSACATAAQELGYGEEAKNYYKNLGYRWYHFLPDFMMDDPFFFYKKSFWRRTFLAKYYPPKYDYREQVLKLDLQ